jgi:hypothetical protein
MAEETFGGEGMRCFNPGLGFAIGANPEMVEVLVCLECRYAYFFRGEERLVRTLSDEGYRLLGEFYREVFPGNDPKHA